MLPVGSVLWVLSRRLTRCSTFDLPPLSWRKRVAALQLQVRQLSPFADTGAYAALGDKRATVWYWDRNEIDGAARAAGFDPDKLWIVPEPALLPPADAGVRLIDCLEGCEAQAWNDGELLASQWWPQAPSASEWTMFARQLGAAGVGLEQKMPARQKLERLALPWAANALPDERRGARGDLERLGYTAGVFVAVVWAGWLGGAWLKLAYERSHIASEAAALRASAAPAVRARLAALDDAQYVARIVGLARQPDPRLVLAAIAKALPPEGITLNEIDLRDGALRAQLASTSANPAVTTLVQSLNDSRILANAKAATEVGGRLLNVTADLRVEGR